MTEKKFLASMKTVFVFFQHTNGLLAFVHNNMKIEGVRSICGKQRSIDPSPNQIFIKENMPELSNNTHYNVSDHKKLINEFLVTSQKNQLMEASITDITFRQNFAGSQRNAHRNEENRICFGTWNKLSYWPLQSTLPEARHWIIEGGMSTSYIS